MQHIVTKYFGPSNTKGSRIKATNHDAKRSVWVSRELSLRAEDSHKLAALTLAKKLWTEQHGELWGQMVGYQVDGNSWMWFFEKDPFAQRFLIND